MGRAEGSLLLGGALLSTWDPRTCCWEGVLPAAPKPGLLVASESGTHSRHQQVLTECLLHYV